MLWVVSFYVLTAALLLVGTFYDLQIDKALYNPENAFVLFLQKYGEVPRFALWGPAAALLYASLFLLDTGQSVGSFQSEYRASCSSAGFGTG